MESTNYTPEQQEELLSQIRRVHGVEKAIIRPDGRVGVRLAPEVKANDMARERAEKLVNGLIRDFKKALKVDDVLANAPAAAEGDVSTQVSDRFSKNALSNKKREPSATDMIAELPESSDDIPVEPLENGGAVNKDSRLYSMQPKAWQPPRKK